MPINRLLMRSMISMVEAAPFFMTVSNADFTPWTRTTLVWTPNPSRTCATSRM